MFVDEGVCDVRIGAGKVGVAQSLAGGISRTNSRVRDPGIKSNVKMSRFLLFQ